MRTLPFALLAPLVLPVLLGAPLSAQDTLVLADGRTIEGVRVTKAGLAEIEYAQGAGRRATTATIESAKVRAIRLGDTSEGYREAQARREEGDIAQAAAWLEEEAAKEENGDVLRAQARIEAAELWRLAGGWSEAIAAYDRLLADFPDSRHVPQARLGKARVLMERGDAGAGPALAEFVTAAEAGGWGERWVEQGRLLQAAQQILAGEDETAALEALRAETDSEAVRAACDLWIGRWVLTRDPSGAIARFDAVLDARFDVDPETAAGAFNGRGRCYFAFAEAAEDPADKESWFTKALLDFLRVVVRYPDVGSEQAHALFWAGQCFLNTPSLANAAARGRGLLKECADRFPKTLWGQRAAAGG